MTVSADLRIALLQDEIIANDPAANLAAFAARLERLEQACDLIVLPEVFTTGFCKGARDHAEVPDGRAYHWLHEQAERTGAVITGSLVVKERDQFFNRLVWMTPSGEYQTYDKRHLFRMAGEHLRYQQGHARKIFTVNGWRVLAQICYDLRFPVFSRNQQDYDLAIYPANWPAARELHWRRLLQARAIENLSFVAGVNRVGTDEAGQVYSGDSAIYHPDGRCLIESQTAQMLCATLRAQELRDYRERFPAHLDQDDFALL